MRVPTIVQRLRREEEGSTLLLTICYGMLALALILVVVAATSVYVEHRRLFSLADGAALAGAEAFALEQATFDGDSVSPRLADAAVEHAAAAWVAEAGTDLTGAHLVQASSGDGRGATATVGASWRPPVLTLFVPEGLPLTATATARSVFTD